MKTILVFIGAVVLSFLCFSFKFGSTDFMTWGEEARVGCTIAAFFFYSAFYLVKFLKGLPEILDKEQTAMTIQHKNGVEQ